MEKRQRKISQFSIPLYGCCGSFERRRNHICGVRGRSEFPQSAFLMVPCESLMAADGHCPWRALVRPYLGWREKPQVSWGPPFQGVGRSYPTVTFLGHTSFLSHPPSTAGVEQMQRRTFNPFFE